MPKMSQREAFRAGLAIPSRSLWRRGKWWFTAAGAASAIGLVWLAVLALLGAETPGGTAPVIPAQGSGPVQLPYTQGSPKGVATSLPNFPLRLYQGQHFIGSEQLGFHDLLGKKPVVINYWASNCPPCSAEMPDFEKVWRKYSDRVMFLGLDVGRFAGLGGPDTSRRELLRLGITYAAAPAPDVETVRELGVLVLPSTDFITPDGKVHRKWSGALNETKLTELVEDLLKGQPIASEGGGQERGLVGESCCP